MRRVLLALTAFLLTEFSYAQHIPGDEIKKDIETNKDTVAWIHGGTFHLGFDEGLLHNWSSGGEIASLTVNSRLSGSLTHLMHNKVWANNLDLAYSLYYAYSNGFKPHKMDDRIDYTSKYGFHLDSSKGMYISGLFNFKSQFTQGRDYTNPSWDTFSTSKFLSPAYFTLAPGLEYRKGTEISIFLSPAAARLTVADKYYTSRTPSGAFGIDYNKTSRFQLGAYFSGRYQVKLSKILYFKTRLDIYADYLAKDQKDTLGNVVRKHSIGDLYVLVDSYFSWKMSKFISLTLGATLIYDNSIPYSDKYVDKIGNSVNKNEPAMGLGWWQMKQLWALGLDYKF